MMNFVKMLHVVLEVALVAIGLIEIWIHFVK